MAEVRLRDFRPDDAAAVYRWFNDARVTANLVGSRDRFTEDDAHRWVERAIDGGSDRKWAIAIGGSDQAVGYVGLFGLERPVGPELGLILGDPAVWGRGIAREAERQACVRAFEDYGVHRVHAEIPANHEAAKRIVTWLGFRHEGVMRAAIRRDGETVDNEVWGLLPEDFTRWQRELS